MEVVLLTAGLVALLMAGMAVGVIFSNRELKGSCGGTGGRCACAEAGTPGACKTTDDGAPPPVAREARRGEDGVLIYD
ncbi:MAG: hypothetical protein H6706_12830 [Myxococcales bacterium]|nr:hypothetical protein [Myxococcales bacterium]